MKKFFLISFICFFVTLLPCNAIPAKPGLIRTLTLQDGTTVKAQLVGDEHGHYWLAENGAAYQQVEGSDVFHQINLEEAIAKAKVRRAQANAQFAKRLSPQKVGEVGNYTGQKKGIIILVNFSKTSWSTKADYFNRVVNEVNFSDGNFVGSMYDYFYAQSDGQFQLTFDVVGPVTVSNTQSYYGSNDSSGNDKYPATMVGEALVLADQYVNYADYDWDGDGEVDQVYVVYAGKGEADGGASTTIWPHAWTLSAGHYYGDYYGGGTYNNDGAMVLDGVIIDSYACGGELNGQTGALAGIGTMCHEFSHCLGYPDYYDTDYSGGQGMFSWDLMDNGSYNGDGYRPAGYTTHERWAAGWREPIELTATQQIDNMKPLVDSDAKSYIIYNQGNRNEYYILENRQKQGWDAGIPGEGLLIIHADYDATAWNNNAPNDDPSHQRMTWIPADNQYQYTTYQGYKYYTEAGAANDPFPYGNVNAFNKSTTPAATFYNANTDGTKYLGATNLTVGIKNSDGTVSFYFRGLSNVATPVFSPAAGSYQDAQTVTITCSTEGATIYYTTDGSTPSATNGVVYSSPITIDETTTLQAVAVNADGEESNLAIGKYIIGALLYESLSKYDSANDGTAALSTSYEKLDYKGWNTFSKVFAGGTNNAYAEGGCLKLGSGSAVGSMKTGSLALTGNGTLTFYLKQYGTDTGKLNVSVTGATADVTEFTPSSTWTECTMNLTNCTGNVVITLATSTRRAYLDEIQVVAAKTTKENVTMSFEPTSVELTMGDDFTAPVLTTDPAGLAVTYNSSDETVATVDASTGAVTIVTAGTTTITATFAGNANYYPGSASYTLTVQNPTTSTNRYELVTDASTLVAGDNVLIVYAASPYRRILSTTQKTDNRKATTFVFNEDNTITPSDDVEVIELGMESDKWTFYATSELSKGYLSSYTTDKNRLITIPSVNDNAQATISIASNGDATIIFQGSGSRKYLRYNNNNGDPLFACYAQNATINTLPQIYRQIKVEIEDVPGDVNKDGKVTVADVTALVNILLGQDDTEPYEYDHEAADVDGQNGVTTDDITALINLVLKQ